MRNLDYLSYNQDPEISFFLRRMVDLMEITIKQKRSTTSDFLTPYELRLARDIVGQHDELASNASGGFEIAERQILHIYPAFKEENALDQLGFFQIRRGDMELQHKDVLGSLLGLGIERKKIGDILITDTIIQWVVKAEISSFIEFHLSKIKRYPVKPERIDSTQLKIPKPLFNDIITTVSSLRLDSILSSAFHLSRNDAQQFIRRELVSVDFKKEIKPSFFLQEGSLISCRGKGRVFLKEVLGKTKKEKIRVVLSFPQK